MTIYFYAANDDNYEFSNFSPYGVEMSGEWYDTAEHWFQAQKFNDVNYREKIRRSLKPTDAINLGRTRKIPIRVDWEDIKDEVMKTVVRKKFQTHQKLKEKLLATGNEEIIEISPHDYYWGCGADGSGENRLGIILMEIRDELRGEP